MCAPPTPVSTGLPGLALQQLPVRVGLMAIIQLYRPHQCDLYTNDNDLFFIVCRYTGPLDYDEAFQEIKTALGEGFWGPPKSGVYSPSVQYTLFQMAKLALQRCICRPAAMHTGNSQ